MTNDKEIERIAKELSDLYWDSDTGMEGFITMAKHVQKMILEARRNETDRYLDVITSSNEYYCKRTLELNQQLSALNARSKE